MGLVRPLVRALFVNAPFPIDETLRSALPQAKGWNRAAGFGQRLTAAGVLPPGFAYSPSSRGTGGPRPRPSPTAPSRPVVAGFSHPDPTPLEVDVAPPQRPQPEPIARTRKARQPSGRPAARVRPQEVLPCSNPRGAIMAPAQGAGQYTEDLQATTPAKRAASAKITPRPTKAPSSLYWSNPVAV